MSCAKTVRVPLHPLEIGGARRRHFLLALAYGLLQTAGLLVAALCVVESVPAEPVVLPGAVLAAGLGGLAQRACLQHVWQGWPGERPVPMPVSCDCLHSTVAAVLLTTVATAASFGTAGGPFLAAVIGLGAALTAASSFRRLAGRAPQPARQVPALLVATALSWLAAGTLGGLGIRGLLNAVLAVAAVILLTTGVARTCSTVLRVAPALRPRGRPWSPS